MTCQLKMHHFTMEMYYLLYVLLINQMGQSWLKKDELRKLLLGAAS